MKKVPSGMGAYGHRVPPARLQNGLVNLREMSPGLKTEDALTFIGKVAAEVEADEPYLALGAANKKLDLTGSYRLLAALLTDPAPEARP